MASLETRLLSLATRLGTEFKAIRTITGALASLTTTDKATLVAAINEVKAQVTGVASPTSLIDDTTPASNKVFSSVKTNAAIAAALAGLVNSAPGTLDTLAEIATALGSDPALATTLTTALGNRVRFDAAQTLTAPQKVQANANMGSLSLVQSGDPDADLVAAFEAALL